MLVERKKREGKMGKNNFSHLSFLQTPLPATHTQIKNSASPTAQSNRAAPARSGGRNRNRRRHRNHSSRRHSFCRLSMQRAPGTAARRCAPCSARRGSTAQGTRRRRQTRASRRGRATCASRGPGGELFSFELFFRRRDKKRERKSSEREKNSQRSQNLSPLQNQKPNRDSTGPGACPRAELVQRWNERNKRRKKKDSSALSPPTPTPTSPPGGLPLPELLSAAAAFLANAPVELYESPLNPRYWSDAPLRSARESAAAALEALWPERYREATSFPLRLPEPEGPTFSREWNATAALAHAAYRQIGRAWAAVHALVHNAPDPLSPRQAEASAALALWLRQHVSCCNCRGFFSQLLNEVGLPPIGSTSREEHARWWWRTHNAVSEHAASTRGG